MTRIIAGFAGSLTIAVPPSGTRPTSDRVREAIFSALQARDAIEGSRVLDLYAGSGALGLESLSRGAAHIALVEKAPKAAALCRKNIATVLGRAPKGSRPTAEVVVQSVQTFLESAPGEWDLVFLDPPYDLSEDELARALDALVPRLAADAVVVVERGSRTPEPSWPAGLEHDRTKAYGETVLYWLTAG